MRTRSFVVSKSLPRIALISFRVARVRIPGRLSGLVLGLIPYLAASLMWYDTNDVLTLSP